MKAKVILIGFKGKKRICTEDVSDWTPRAKWYFKYKMEKEIGINKWIEIEKETQ